MGKEGAGLAIPRSLVPTWALVDSERNRIDGLIGDASWPSMKAAPARDSIREKFDTSRLIPTMCLCKCWRSLSHKDAPMLAVGGAGGGGIA